MVVPPEYCGVWSRTLLQTAGNARVDSTTRVYWLQTASSLFGDLRVPLSLETEELPPLGACGLEELQLLCCQESFAGTAAVVDDICTWTREVDLAPPPQQPDAGRIRWVN